MVGAGSRLPDLISPEGLARLQADPVVPSELPGVTLLGAGLQLIFAAFNQLHSAIYPGTYASLVTTADVLRLVFYAILLLGVQTETRADLRALRQANRELETLPEAEAVRAALEEGTRLAREIHDGLVQDQDLRVEDPDMGRGRVAVARTFTRPGSSGGRIRVPSRGWSARVRYDDIGGRRR